MLIPCDPGAGTRYVEGRDGGGDGGSGRHPAGGAEVVSPPLKAEGALEPAELPEGRWSFALGDAWPRPPGGTRELPGRPGQRAVAGVRLRTEAAYELPILWLVQAHGFPHERGPTLFRDLLGEPLERFAGLRAGRQHPDGVVEQHRAEAAEPAPDAEAEATGLAGEAGGEEDPAERGHVWKVTAVTTLAIVEEGGPGRRILRAAWLVLRYRETSP
jgi:hypothetical protein